MVRKGSLIEYTGNNSALIFGKLYSVHEVKDGAVWLWVPSGNGNWMKKRVPVHEIKVIVE